MTKTVAIALAFAPAVGAASCAVFAAMRGDYLWALGFLVIAGLGAHVEIEGL